MPNAVSSRSKTARSTRAKPSSTPTQTRAPSGARPAEGRLDAAAHPRVVGEPTSFSAGAATAAAKLTPRGSAGNADALRLRAGAPLEGKGFEPTPDVVALLARYEPGGIQDLGRPMERVLQTVAAVDSALRTHASSPDALVDAMMATDLRKTLFTLESQLRLYAPLLGKDVKTSLEQVKALEDGLGAWGLRRDLLKAVDGKPVPPAVLKAMKEDERSARAAVKDLVAGWLPNDQKRGQVPVLNKLVDAMEEATWPSYKEDKAYLRKAVGTHITEMLAEPLDLNNMQEGIHELRRQARWVPLFMLSSGGAFQLDEARNPVASLKGLLTSPEAQSPFARMPAADRERDPITVSKSLYLANSRFVAQLGDVKDRGEMPEYMAEVYVKVGAAADLHDGVGKARALMGRTETDESIRGEAKALWTAFENSGALRALEKEFLR